MPRKPKNKQKYAIYDNNVKILVIENEDDIRSALFAYGFECATRCDLDLALPEGKTFIALKVNPIKGTREVHHIVMIKE